VVLINRWWVMMMLARAATSIMKPLTLFKNDHWYY
jgi:hypothetical protein